MPAARGSASRKLRLATRFPTMCGASSGDDASASSSRPRGPPRWRRSRGGRCGSREEPLNPLPSLPALTASPRMAHACSSCPDPHVQRCEPRLRARATSLVTACSRGDARSFDAAGGPWQVSIDIDATDRRLRRAGRRRHGWRRLGAQSAIIGGDFVRLPARRPAASPCAPVQHTRAHGEVKCFRRRLPPGAEAAAPARPRRRRRRRRSWRPWRPRALAWRLDARRRLQAARRRRRTHRGGARAAPGEPERAARWAPRRRWVGPGSGPAAPRRSVPCGVWGGLWRRRGAPDPVRVRPVSPL